MKFFNNRIASILVVSCVYNRSANERILATMDEQDYGHSLKTLPLHFYVNYCLHISGKNTFYGFSNYPYQFVKYSQNKKNLLTLHLLLVIYF